MIWWLFNFCDSESVNCFFFLCTESLYCLINIRKRQYTICVSHFFYPHLLTRVVVPKFPNPIPKILGSIQFWIGLFPKSLFPFGTPICRSPSNKYSLNKKTIDTYIKWIRCPSDMPKSTKLAISKEKSIFDYWSSLEKILFYLKLSKFVHSLMRIPSSEAAEERMFWKQRKILTEQRSRTS